ncbi:MAG TPA: bifunctional DNA-binding transcriptional regulator/O6-methylguanine-DNA methyltransferase Ada [Burkholderiales bacterium]|jgi:AraC family transcriptional regulator of adaptative response/methylated-DNA-[protein]-cysteine methyltransferase|nr:bifunctional DNA-binding transcriptional regulator/O6-methylguanine-DNA methyltransferase Ada [Burkholderiales bacterium]
MNDEQRWEAVRNRDARCDGQFLYGVLTTGVFCRPSCPSRRPLRKNVRFYATAEEARRDGLRPCLRCRPLAAPGDDPHAARIHAVARYIEAHADETHPLGALAARARLSPFHFQRSFKAVVGVSPKQYLDACRMKRLKTGLRAGERVTGAIYDAGFGSASRVYERADSRLGMTPRQYREGGAGVAISYAVAETPLGLTMMAATDRGLCFVQFGASERELLAQLEREYPRATIAPMDAAARVPFAQWMAALAAHLEGTRPRLDLPLDVRGTAFQMKVWSFLQRIPYGEVRSYAEVAKGIGAPKAVRAVASACAANRIAVAIPCHRVIRGDGGLGGYRWGLARKRALIDAERSGRARSG